MIEFPPYRLDPRAGRLWRGSSPVALRPKAWALLCYLAERPGALILKEELHAAVWGEAVVSDDTLTRTIAELRQALRDDAKSPRIIETVHRRGFRFIARPHEPSGDDPSGAARNTVPVPKVSTLVGRDNELERLWGSFRQAAAGNRQVVFVEGDAGIGKSALVTTFLDAIGHSGTPALVGYGQCLELYGEREPYMAVLEALERLGQGAGRERLMRLMRVVSPEWLAQLPSLQPADGKDSPRGRHASTTPQRMLREFASLAEAISAEQPLVLVLEDLHWSDQGTVDLVSVLAQRPERARLMLVGTLRPAQAAALDHPIQQVLTLLRTRRRCTELVVEYLTRHDVAEYLGRRFKGACVAPEVASIVHGHTDGNALFMIVLVDHLVARGWLAEADGVWQLTAPRGAIEQAVPDDLRQLIEGQLRDVSPDERDTLEVASVVGVSFDAPAVAAGLGITPDRVETTCHRLCNARQWIHYVGNHTWPDGVLAARYAFRHALYQRTLHDRLSPSRRAGLHERIGRRLETAYEGRTAEASGELARHFQESGDPGRARTYLEQAAARAYDRRAYRDVIACIDPAIRLLDAMPDTPGRAREELRLRRLYAVAQSQAVGYAAEALLDNLRRTQSLCEKVDDRAALFDVLTQLCLFYANGDLDRAERIGRQMAEVAERLDSSAVLESAYMRGATAVWRGESAIAHALLGEVLASTTSLDEAERPYGVNPLVAARSFEGIRRWTVGDAAGVRVMLREALQLAERHGHPFTTAQAHTFGAVPLVLDEEWDEAARLSTVAVSLSEEYGFPRWRGVALAIHGRALVGQGKETPGLAEIREGIETLRRAKMTLGNSLLLTMLAAACLDLGRLDQGLAAAEEGLHHCDEASERLFEAELWRLKGHLLARGAGARSRPRRAVRRGAEECWEKARAVARAQGAATLERRASCGSSAPTSPARRPDRPQARR